ARRCCGSGNPLDGVALPVAVDTSDSMPIPGGVAAVRDGAAGDAGDIAPGALAATRGHAVLERPVRAPPRHEHLPAAELQSRAWSKSMPCPRLQPAAARRRRHGACVWRKGCWCVIHYG